MRWWVLAMALGSFAGCGPPNVLRGSYAASPGDLEFSDVSFRALGDFVVVQYERRLPRVTEVLCKVAILTSGLEARTTYRDDDFKAHVTLGRTMIDGSTFPPVKRGSFRFEELHLMHRGTLVGRFDVVFDDGRTFGGDFGGRLVEVVIE